MPQSLLAILLYLLLGGVEQEGPLRILSVEATAPTNTYVRPIEILVTVQNQSKQTVERPTIHMTLKPRYKMTEGRAYTPGGKADDPRPATILDPTDSEQQLDLLYPGRTRVLRFSTPYLSKYGFTSQRGFFEVEDINIRRTFVVEFKASIEL